MSIIQDIRDKYAKVSIALIALSLVGFLLMDRFAGKGSGGVDRSKTVGSVNGRSIAVEDFDQELQMNISGYERQGYTVDPSFRQNLVNNVWDQMIERSIMNSEADKLGIIIGKKEKGDIYFGDGAPQDFKNAGMDETGHYDAARAKKNIEQYLKSTQTTPDQRAQLQKYMDQLVEMRIREKYQSLFTNSANVARWFVEKEIADNSQIAKVNIVKSLYNSDSLFRDTTIKVSDKEIADYISSHKDSYKQDETRTINFILFSAQPTAADSAVAKTQLETLKPEFDTTKDVKLFLERNGSSFNDAFVSVKQISPTAKDELVKLTKNAVYGPYIDAGSFVLAKMIDSKTMPDSAKAKHILIATMNPQTQTATTPDSVAKARIDSIMNAVKKGASFDELAKKYSDDNQGPDGGSAAKGGDLGWFAQGMMVPEFNNFCFEHAVGAMDVVKTQFGYHLIQITGQKDNQPFYKIAYLDQKIAASQSTVDSAQQAANEFAGSVKDLKSFDDQYQKSLKAKGINKGIGANIKRTDGNISGLQGFARTFVKDIYSAKVGEVLKPVEIDNNWVVAVVTEANKEGTMSVDKVRPGIETMLRHKKIANQLQQKAGTVSNLESVATLLGKPVQTIDSVRMMSGDPKADLPYDPKAFGVMYNPANKGKVFPQLIVGEFGVYGIQVDNVSATSSAMNVADIRKQEAAQNVFLPLQSLKNNAKIVDKRTSGTNNY